VSENPWPDNSFDIVTAFETICFWPDFAKDLREVRRVPKPGGCFFICNEMSVPEQGEAPYQFWIKALNLKTCTASGFQKYLTEAGFVGVNVTAEGRCRMCVNAKKGQGGTRKAILRRISACRLKIRYPFPKE
jgi:SAM-dependent methyltransferase